MLIFIIAVIIVYGIIILWFTDGLMKYDSTQSYTNLDTQPLVSVIVSARNEEFNISQLVSALNQQSYPHHLYEILIANDRSTDGTAQVLKELEYQQSNLTVVTISETPLGWAPKKWALHQLVDKSRGEILLQTDADCIPVSSWIETFIKEFSDESVGFVSGPAPMTNCNGFVDDVFEMDSLAQDAFSAGALSHGLALSCTGRNIAFRKIVYDEVKGYEEIQHFKSGDDDLLLQKIASQTKWDIKFSLNKDSIVGSAPTSSLIQFIRQRLRFASKGLSYYKMQSSVALKSVLPLLFLSNLLVVLGLYRFIQSSFIIWLLPLIFKSCFDAVITYTFYSKLKMKWSFSVFVLLSFVHPIYVVIFGALGPFVSINWKR